MKLVEVNWAPTDRQLRQFGLICLFALPALAWLWRAGPTFIGSCGAIGASFALGGVLKPKLLKPVYLGMSIITMPLGIVSGELAMLLIYFGIFLPMALVARMVNRDALQLRLDRRSATYWQPKKQPTAIQNYYRQS